MVFRPPSPVSRIDRIRVCNLLVTEHLTIRCRLQQACFLAVLAPSIHCRRPAEFDFSHTLAIETARAIEEVENLRLGRAARQWFNVEQRHGVRIVCRA